MTTLPDSSSVLDMPISEMTGTFVGLLAIALYIAVIFSAFVIGIVNYILQAIALFSIARKRGMGSAWCAWLPICNTYLVGAISDFHDRQRGLNRHWGKTLVISLLFGPVMLIVGYLLTLFTILFAVALGGGEPNVLVVVIAIIFLYACIFVGAMFAAVAQFGTYICLYKIFDVIVPEKAVKYIIISLIIPLGCAICLMCARKSLIGVPEELLPAEEPDFADLNTL
jgi:hypothetical protein